MDLAETTPAELARKLCVQWSEAQRKDLAMRLVETLGKSDVDKSSDPHAQRVVARKTAVCKDQYVERVDEPFRH